MAAYQLWDVQAAFTVAQNVKLLIGVQNLFDANPPLQQCRRHAFGYDPTYADPRGRRWTLGFQGELVMKRGSLKLGGCADRSRTAPFGRVGCAD